MPGEEEKAMAVARQYTTPAPAETVAGTRSRLVLAEGGLVAGPKVAFSVVLLGMVTVLVGAWGAAAPYFGPDLGFAADRFTAWQWSETSLLLALVPGAVAVLCGLWVLAAAAHPSYGRRPDLWLLGLVIAASGAWFVVGQYVWRSMGNRAFIVPSGPTHFMLKELCFAVGPGVILVLCGALFMGWAVRRQLAVVAERYPATASTVAPAGVAPAAPVVGQPVVAQPVVGEAAPATVATPIVEPVPPVGAATAPTGTMAPPPAVEPQPIVEEPVTRVDPATGAAVTRDPATGAAVVTARPAHAAGQPTAVERPVATGPTGEPVA